MNQRIVSWNDAALELAADFEGEARFRYSKEGKGVIEVRHIRVEHIDAHGVTGWDLDRLAHRRFRLDRIQGPVAVRLAP